MSCFDGNVYLRKDYIVCDPKYGISLNDLVEKIISNMPISGGSSSNFSFSCSLLEGCSIASLSDVSLTDIESNDVLKWNGSSFVPGTVTASSSVKLKVGTDTNNEDIVLTDSTENITPLLIKGTGRIAVSYDIGTNTFTITDYTSPEFNEFVARVGTSSSATSLYFGETLNTINFRYTSISLPDNVKTIDKINLQQRVGSTPNYNNLKTAIPYVSPLPETGQTVQLTDIEFTDITKNTFGSETFRLEGQTTQDGPFYSVNSSIKWITNYYYGYVTNKTYQFVTNDLTGTATSGVTRLSGGGNVDKEAFNFSFPNPQGKFLWMAIPSNLISGASFTLGGLSLGEAPRQTLSSVPSGTVIISYTIVISDQTQSAPLTINLT
jgi:hypothetical protein